MEGVKMSNSKMYILKDKRTTNIASDVSIGKNVIIYGNNTIDKGTVIEDNVTIFPNCHISGSVICKGSKIWSSMIENSKVGNCCLVGPYAHLRPKSILKDNVKVGNFCEVKNSVIGENTKMGHMSYVGDATIGKNCNIGCGTVFANYNGKIKNRSIVGDGCFIGSNSNIIAPCVLGNKTYVCAGTTLDKSTKEYDFVIGRPQLTIKSNYSVKYLGE